LEWNSGVTLPMAPLGRITRTTRSTVYRTVMMLGVKESGKSDALRREMSKKSVSFLSRPDILMIVPLAGA